MSTPKAPTTASTGTVASSPEQWELAAEILDEGEKHPALKVIKDQYEELLKGLKTAAQKSANMKKIGVGRTEDPTLVLAHVVPELRELAEKAKIVAAQMEQKLK